MIPHRPGLLRTSSSQCCFLNRQTSIPAGLPTRSQRSLPADVSSQQPTLLPPNAAAESNSVNTRPLSPPAAGAAEPLPSVAATVKLPAPGRSFFDAMKFNGPAPELINGRLAMIGILAAARNEIQTGATVVQQVQQAPVWLWAVLLLWVYASMVPILKGARHEAFGIFSPCAELTNGRAAMLGFAILLALEYKAQVPFF